ncbi:hypothetical protein [Aeromonas media]|uniref:DUF2169 domain-containing protein n=1 Tax=Aeromonas media TaxID=651 RepID=A0ABX6NYF4_AERME|nr:hypothetical protein [Aeromonas media]MBP6792412.1 hypothetical protein [Aeromonas sp.]MBP8269187.1 hypothetical protein [Aeromonas sp.]MBP8281368.1 hypothetical protein [Aeromonas sp.]MBP9662172.1 hypothetical protein [Aeromonas sp.]MBS4642187.1 hypothetical protein [Aeromonas media]
MARTDARLELRKARKTNAALELNPLLVVRYVAVLQGTSLPPSLACSPGLVLPSLLQGRSAEPVLATSAGLVHPGHLSAELAAPVAVVSATVVIEATLASTTRAVLHDIEAGYDINVYRGPSHTSVGDWDRAALVTTAVASDWQRPALTPATCQGDWQEAGALMAVVVDLSEQLPRHHEPVRGLFDEALPLGASHGQGFDSLPPGHAVTRSLWVEGAPVSRWQVSGYRNPPRQDKVWQPGSWQQGAPQGATLSGQQWQLGLPLHKGWLERWEEAMQPPWGTSPPPKPPIKPERPDKRTKVLAFGRPRGDASLEFVWFGQAHIVIPTRRVYLVSNAASIVRVRDGIDIPATSLSIELDTDSWAWQFTSQIPRIAAAEMTDEEEVSIHVNGQQWDCVCDGWQSSQSFARESATLTGRSRTAYLSPTHVLPQAVSEIGAATMAQLAEALLPYGWTLDWQAPDWLVPGGFFSLESQTPIEAIKYLAEAAGGFVLPHQRERHLVIKPRYPTVPWQLDGALADVAIPRAIITTLGSDFQPGQAANGIYVNGGHQGINARVLRQGTAGDRQAPAITHPLVCDVVAARAQGVVGLAKTMPRRTQTIELPLSSDTGLILPGALLAVDGWKGFNRGVRVAAGMQGRAMTVRQQLSVERFV